MIKIKNLRKSFNNKEIINIEEFQFHSTGLYFIYGRSGCGKTTFLNCISLLDNSYSGEIYINNKNSKNNEDLLRKMYISYMLQKPILLENFTVFENLKCFLNFNDDYLLEKLKEFEILDLKDRLAKNLSGGQKQKVSLLRTILENKNIIICDEPTGNLNKEYVDFVINHLKEISKNKLVIVVSHQKNLYFDVADVVIEFKNKALNIVKENVIGVIPTNDNLIYKNKYKLMKKIYIKNILEKRKIKNITLTSILSLIVLIFSLIFVLKYNITTSINNAFSSFYGENEIDIVSKLPTIYQKRNTPSKSELIEIFQELNKENNYRYFYENDFNLFFPDSDILSFKGKYTYLNLEKYSITHFNEFTYIKNINDKSYLLREELEDDEIIISINNKLMLEICLFYKIERSFNSLYQYLKTNNIYLSLFVKNYEWEYEDEQIFKLAGFVVENNINIYHSNKFFNEILFETKLKLPSSIYDETYKYPWTLKKAAILELNKTEANKFILNKNLNNYYLNKLKWSDMRTKFNNYLCENDSLYFVYKKTKDDYFNLKYLDQIKTDEILYCNSLYLNLSSNYLNGFIFNVFVGKDQQDIDFIVDNYYSKNNINPNSNNILIFNSLLKSSNSIKFKFNKNIEDNKFVISSKFKKTLDLNKELYLLADSFDDHKYMVKKIEIDDYIENDNEYIIFGNKLSLISFMRDYLYMNYNLYNFSSIKIYNDNENLNFYKSLFYEDKVNEPLKEINDQVNSIISYFSTTLNIFSISSIVLTMILYSIVIINNIYDSKKEIGTLYVLSFSKREISIIYNDYILKKTAKSTFFNFIFVIFLSLTINIIIKNLLKISIVLSFPLITFLASFLFCMFVYIMSYLIQRKYINNLNVILLIRN